MHGDERDLKKQCARVCVKVVFLYRKSLPYGTVPYSTTCFVFFLRLYMNYIFFHNLKKKRPCLTFYAPSTYCTTSV
jgi:hypothetical protein